MDFFYAFHYKNIEILDLHNLHFYQIYPFSKLYLDGNLDYSEEDYSEEDDSGDSTELGLN